MKIKISICICTYKRKSIKQTLQGVLNQELSDQYEIQVLIIDSDVNGSAFLLVDNFIKKNPNIKIEYFKANESGLVFARNLALEKAKGNFYAFVDDDEVPENNWIKNLYETSIKYNADVVFGKVDIKYPENTPKWILDSDIFRYGRSCIKTGTSVKVGASGNVLINSKVIINSAFRFDHRFNETGGEDTDFFYKVGKKYKMVFCDNAVVVETIESKRVNYSFLIKRAIRSGETYFIIFESSDKNTFTLLLNFLKFISALVIALLMSIFGLSRSINFHLKAAANFGKLKAYFGFNPIKLYKVN